MRNRFTALLPVIFIGIVGFVSCAKEINGPSSLTTSLENESKAYDQGNAIRLVSGQNIFGSQFYEYDESGLLQKWGSGTSVFHHRYDPKKRLTTSTFFFDGQPYWTIYFTYNKNEQVIGEVWRYLGSNITDRSYKYDSKGNMVLAIDNLSDAYSVFTYSNEGNMIDFTIFEEGRKAFKIEFTYLQKLKNPESAIPGLPYNYNSSFGFLNRNKWYQTSHQFVFFDVNGNEFSFTSYDPEQTILERGRNNYVASGTFFDVVNNFSEIYEFEYDCCGSRKAQNGAWSDEQQILEAELLSPVSASTVSERSHKLQQFLRASGKKAVVRKR